MRKYTVVAYRKYTAWDKVYLEVEANNEKEALEKAIKNPDEALELDYKGLEIEDSTWEDESDWRVLKP